MRAGDGLLFGKDREMEDKIDLLLASRSPRRRELLALCGRPFRVKSADTDEKALTDKILRSRGAGESFEALCRRLVLALAEAKAEALWADEAPDSENLIVLAADTIVASEENIYGKAKDKADAVRMLRALAGKTHQVFTGTVLLSAGKKDAFTAMTEVSFYPLDDYTERFILDYAESGSPLDKAGGYGIQDRGALLVKEIRGDYYNVVGLPVAETSRHLEDFIRQQL